MRQISILESPLKYNLAFEKKIDANLHNESHVFARVSRSIGGGLSLRLAKCDRLRSNSENAVRLSLFVQNNDSCGVAHII